MSLGNCKRPPKTVMGEIKDLFAAAGVLAIKSIAVQYHFVSRPFLRMQALDKGLETKKARLHLAFYCGKGEIRTRGRVTPTTV